jgi:hypothetical protein
VEDWKYVTYLVFDAYIKATMLEYAVMLGCRPKHGGKYEERVEWLKKTVKKDKESTCTIVLL